MQRQKNYFALLTLAISSALATCAHSQSVTAGQWQLSSVMQGAPSGEHKSSQSRCIDDAAFAMGIEQAILNANAADTSSGKPTLKCTVSALRRDGDQSSWQASCEGPRGAMPGTGNAVIQTGRVEIKQSFDLKTPFGAMKLSQVINAERIGACK